MQPTHITLHFQISKFKQPITLQLQVLNDSHNPHQLENLQKSLNFFSPYFLLDIICSVVGTVPISLVSANYHL